MEGFVEYIKRIKEGDTDQFLKILEKFEPLIRKYTRLCFGMEKEDSRQEYVLALWEAVVKMEYYTDEGKCVIYLQNAVYRKYLELCRKVFKVSKGEVDGIELLEFYAVPKKEIDDLLVVESIKEIISAEKGIVYDILYRAYIEEMTDAEIAKQYHVSRQYVNRIKRKYRKILYNALYLNG